MKKLIFCVILFSLFASVFASPKIPKSSHSTDIKDKLQSKDNLVYINDSGLNLYAIRGITTNSIHELEFSSISLITKVEIRLVMMFDTEDALDYAIRTIDTSNLEVEFEEIRKAFLKGDIKPVILLDKNDSPELIMYTGHF